MDAVIPAAQRQDDLKEQWLERGNAPAVCGDACLHQDREQMVDELSVTQRQEDLKDQWLERRGVDGGANVTASPASVVEPGPSFQGIQCDVQCRQSFIDIGVIPPPVTEQGGNQFAPAVSTQSHIECDAQCRAGYVALGVIPPPETN